jgi:hypothetical protein
MTQAAMTTPNLQHRALEDLAADLQHTLDDFTEFLETADERDPIEIMLDAVPTLKATVAYLIELRGAEHGTP